MKPSPFPIGLWFSPQSWQQQVDGSSWTRGLALYRSNKVLSLDIEQLDDERWLLFGEVQGSQRQPYDLSIELELTAEGQIAFWDSECSCPVGHQCKHGVALMLKASYDGLRLITAKPSKVVPKPSAVANEADLRAAFVRLQDAATQAAAQAAERAAEETARRASDAQLTRWLLALDNAKGKTRVPDHVNSGPNPGQGGKKLAPERLEQFLFLLKPLHTEGDLPRLRLEVVTAYTRVNGDWSKPKPIKYTPASGQPVFDRASEAEHELLQLIRVMPDSQGYNSSYGVRSKVIPSGQAGLLALQIAADTSRLLLDTGDLAPGRRVTWGPAQALHWDWQKTPASKTATEAWLLHARCVDQAAELCINSPPLYLDTKRGLCGPILSDGMSSQELLVLLKAPPLQEAAMQKYQLDIEQRLGSLPLPPVLKSTPTLTGVAPTARLQLTPTDAAERHLKGLIRARLRFDYQGHRGWWASDAERVLVDGRQGQILLQRDLAAELQARQRLTDLGLSGDVGGEFVLHGQQDQQRWLQWADDDYAVLRDAGFEVSLDRALENWITRADSLTVRMQAEGRANWPEVDHENVDGDAESDDNSDQVNWEVGDGGDDSEAHETTSPWFDLSLGMEINGARQNILPWLPSLIAAAAASPLDPLTGLRQIPPFLFLPDPSGQGYLRLPTETLKPWLAALLELVGDRSPHDFSGDSLKLSRLDALRASAALGEGAVWEGSAALRTMLKQLAGQTELPETPLPAGVHAELRPYQRQGLSWLQFLRQHGLSGILADDMGLGKTLQTLAHIQAEKEAGRLTRPALIIAPVSLMGNWKREAARFCPELRCLVLHGKDRHDAAHDLAEQDVVIAPYSLLHRDRERWLETQWHLVVLDEAQNIKNASTHAAQVAAQLPTRHRLCLSGTPMENHLGEIWSLFHFLMPGFLGSQTRFNELFRAPIEKMGDTTRLAQLRARITPFMLRRTKALVAADLPPKVETVLRVELSGEQANLYETIRLGMEKTVREALDAKGLAKSQITILDALLKLRQVCCDPKLLKLDAARKVKTSAKLEHLMELLPEMLAEGRRVLLFSQFTSMLTLIEAELLKRGLSWVKLTGQSQKRDALIEQFTNGAVPLFLISLKAGGVGLNLPQADTVIHYDPWWNPAVENQATDRAHRIGQTQSVFVYKLVAQGTIEERILALQERKAALADSVYSGSTARKQPLFTESDLTELLKPLSSFSIG
ncbi:DEAD/DEAH box helicase [Roseateles sp. GG27B]